MKTNHNNHLDSLIKNMLLKGKEKGKGKVKVKVKK